MRILEYDTNFDNFEILKCAPLLDVLNRFAPVLIVHCHDSTKVLFALVASHR